MKFRDLKIGDTFTDPSGGSVPPLVYIKLSENSYQAVDGTAEYTANPTDSTLPYKKFTEIDETKRYLYFDNPDYRLVSD